MVHERSADSWPEEFSEGTLENRANPSFFFFLLKFRELKYQMNTKHRRHNKIRRVPLGIKKEAK
jgi:hypothetical protein